MAHGVDSIVDVLSEFRDDIDQKTIEDYSTLFLMLTKYMEKKRKREFHKMPDFFLELDTTLEDITDYLKNQKNLIKDKNTLSLMSEASNLGSSLSVMFDDSMMSTDPVFFERILLLKEKIKKISKSMSAIILMLGSNEYMLNQSGNLWNLIG